MRQPLGAAAALIVTALPPPAAAQAPRRDATPMSGTWRCGEKTYCTQMASCAEAMFHFQACGPRRLDGDRDGVPCERLCGQSPGRSTGRR